MGGKSLGEKVLDIFVVREEERAAPPLAPKASAKPALPDPPPPQAPSERRAERGEVDRAIALVESLPAGTPVEAQRAIAVAALGAFGISIEEIRRAGESEIVRLQDADERTRLQHDEIVGDGQASIERLREKIAEIESLLATQRAALSAAQQETRARRERVTRMLAFFDDDGGGGR